jgi:hypothetical protein
MKGSRNLKKVSPVTRKASSFKIQGHEGLFLTESEELRGFLLFERKSELMKQNAGRG